MNRGDRIRIARDHRGRFLITNGSTGVGELRLMRRSGPVLKLGERELRVRPYEDEWRLADEETGATQATLRPGRRGGLTVAGHTFTLRRRLLNRTAVLTAGDRTLLRFERVQDGRHRSLVAHVVEPPPPGVDATLLFAFAAAAVVLKGNFRPPKQKAANGERVGAWSRGGQWGTGIAFYGGFGAAGDLSEGGSWIAGDAGGGGGGFGDFGGGDFGGGGGGDGGGGGGGGGG